MGECFCCIARFAQMSEKWLRRAATFGVLVPSGLYMCSSTVGSAVLGCTFVAGGSWEYSGFIAAIVQQEATRSRRMLQTACGTIVCLAGATGVHELLDAALVLAAALLAAAAWQAETCSDGTAGGKLQQSPFPRVTMELFGVWYLGWTMGHALLLRNMAAEQQWFVCVLVTSFVGDTGALLVGRLARSSGITVHLLAPSTSPHKTWEGVLGHLGASIGTAIMWGKFNAVAPRTIDVVVVGSLISICCICGDLFESALKRAADCKDSGSIFPGH